MDHYKPTNHVHEYLSEYVLTQTEMGETMTGCPGEWVKWDKWLLRWFPQTPHNYDYWVIR